MVVNGNIHMYHMSRQFSNDVHHPLHAQMLSAVTTMCAARMTTSVKIRVSGLQNRNEATRNPAVNSMQHVYQECMLMNLLTKVSQSCTYQHTHGINPGPSNRSFYHYPKVLERLFPFNSHREFQQSGSFRVTCKFSSSRSS